MQDGGVDAAAASVLGPSISDMDSAFAKLDRAKVHRDQLDQEVKAFRDRDPLEFPHTVADHLFDESLVVVTFRVQISVNRPGESGDFLI
jgi:hypothetical protein